MKYFRYYVHGVEYAHLESHPFPVGKTRVVVDGFDLAGNERQCDFDVSVRDTQPPKWSTDPRSVDGEVTFSLDEKCGMSVAEAFQRYELLGWSAAASDNCGVDHIVRQVWQGSTLVHDEG